MKSIHAGALSSAPRVRKVLGQALAVLLLAAAGTVLPATAARAADGCSNEGLTSGSVDGDELRYDQSTKYSKQFFEARDAWNAVGKIKIAQDTATTIADIDVTDVDISTVTWSGLWTRSAVGTDDIQLNGYFLKNVTYPIVRGVIGHEIGHALRFGHFDNRKALMHCLVDLVYDPADPDKAKYHEIWG